MPHKDPEKRKEYDRERSRLRRANNLEYVSRERDRKRALNRAKRATDPEYAARRREEMRKRRENADYRKRERERDRERKRREYSAHPEKSLAKRAKRRANELKATPTWLTKEQLNNMQAIYADARRLKNETGEDWHVDHIVPLTHPDVCGLHVPANLRIVPAKENLSKKNALDKDLAQPEAVVCVLPVATAA